MVYDIYNCTTKLVVYLLISENTNETECLAAEELQYYLSRIYPDEKFIIQENGSELFSEKSICLGTLESQPDLVKYVDASKLKTPESYVVSSF